MKTDASSQQLVVDFMPDNLPMGTGVRATLRYFLSEHHRLFKKVEFVSMGVTMQVVVTLREELTEEERAGLKSDIEEAVKIAGKFAELKHLR